MNILINSVKSELYKRISTRLFWILLFSLFLMYVYFVYLGIDLFRPLTESIQSGHITDLTGEVRPYKDEVLGLLVGPHFQSICLFFPLILCYLSGREYKYGEYRITNIIIPNIRIIILSRIFVTAIISVILVTCSYVLTMMWVGAADLPDSTNYIIYSIDNMFVLIRLNIYTVIIAIFAESITALFGSSLGGLSFMLLMIGIALSGSLNTISPFIHNLSPIVALDSFVLGFKKYPDQLDLYLASIDMAVHAIVSIVFWHFSLSRKVD